MELNRLFLKVVFFVVLFRAVVDGLSIPVSSLGGASMGASSLSSLFSTNCHFVPTTNSKGNSIVWGTTGFPTLWKRNAGNSRPSSTTTSLNEATVNGRVSWEVENDSVEGATLEEYARREKLKRDMLQLGASYDRGFGATQRGRDEALRVIAKLEACNPEYEAAVGIDGDDSTGGGSSPLTGNWRMIWTTAPDVLILGASPLATVGAIYQIFAPPIVTNVIDLLPRFQSLLTSSSSLLQGGGSLLRAKVQTRASSRPGKPMRVGLVFESVELEPVELFGNDMGFLPPFAFDLPRLPSLLVGLVSNISSDGSSRSSPDAIGFFDVTYLDNEFLVIRQNAPGGLFVFTQVENADP